MKVKKKNLKLKTFISPWFKKIFSEKNRIFLKTSFNRIFNPSGLLVILISLLSVYLLWRQNKLVENQNYLQEASRRSSYVFQIGNIFDAIENELTQDIGVKGKRDLSPQLVGRIIALSHNFRPYRFIDNGELIEHELSPERGQLLISLIYSEIDTKTINIIFKAADFSYADLRQTNIVGKYLAYVNLKNANLYDAFLDKCFMDSANLENANLENTKCRWADFRNVEFFNANLRNSTFRYTNLRRAVFMNANLQYCNFENSNLEKTCLTNSDIKGANFYLSSLDSAYFQYDIDFNTSGPWQRGVKYVNDTFSITPWEGMKMFIRRKK